MRLRNNPEAKTIIKDNNYYCIQEEDISKLPQKPLSIEIGFGKGDFIIEKAKQNPNQLFLGIEMYPSVVVFALKKIELLQEPIDNLKLLTADFMKISKNFENKSIENIFLNFSDPWPKKRHAKRRLTSPNFLKEYKRIIKPKGRLIQKTDNLDLFLYSLETFGKEEWNINFRTKDLYNDPNIDLEENIATEYEKKFHKKGVPIKMLITSPN